MVYITQHHCTTDIDGATEEGGGEKVGNRNCRCSSEAYAFFSHLFIPSTIAISDMLHVYFMLYIHVADEGLPRSKCLHSAIYMNIYSTNNLHEYMAHMAKKTHVKTRIVVMLAKERTCVQSRDVEVKADFAERVVTHVLVELKPVEDVQQVLTACIKL